MNGKSNAKRFFSDHPFDELVRGKRKQRVSKLSDVSNINVVSRGCQPLRAIRYKHDKSRMLKTDQLGIPLKEYSEF